jgi:sugar phosphate isomerase/epimerase
MTPDQLVLSHYSIRHAPFRDRVHAAASAGYSGIGLKLAEYERLRAQGLSNAQLNDILAEHDQRVVEYEAVRGWASTGAAREQYLHYLDTIDRMVEAFGPPHHVQVIGPYEGDLDEAVEGFTQLCGWLDGRGTRAAIEYLPEMSNIPDAGIAWSIVRAAGADNAGLCVDAWHHFRSTDDFDQLAKVPGDRVIDVQLNDGLLARLDPDYYTDCTSYRLVPGQGEFDLVGLIRTLDGMGVDVPISIEVISLELDKLPPDEVARRIAEGARAVLAEAGDAASR